MTIAEAREWARQTLAASARLAASGQSTANLDIAILLAHTLGIDRSRVIAHPELELGDGENAFRDAVERRADGIPVAYIVGEKEFWGLPFRVTPDVLIPKPDTEILVERAIELARGFSSRAGGNRTIQVLDVCTGSGCVAISIKKECPAIDMTATDVSPAALAVARANARDILGGSEAIRFIEGDLRDGLPPARPAEGSVNPLYDLIVSNPPYVPTPVARSLLSDGRSEPMLALDGGTDGLDLVRALVENVRKALAPGGVFLVETGEYNAREAAEFLSGRGFVGVTIRKDLADQDRVVEGTQP